MGYFINLPYLLAMRHQQLCCYQANNVTGMPGDRLIIGLGINTINIIIAYCIMNSFVIGSVAIPDGLQEELTFPISSVYKCHVSSVMCD